MPFIHMASSTNRVMRLAMYSMKLLRACFHAGSLGVIPASLCLPREARPPLSRASSVSAEVRQS